MIGFNREIDKQNILPYGVDCINLCSRQKFMVSMSAGTVPL